MLQKPRLFSSTFFNWSELMISIIQGLLITAGTLFVYLYAVEQGSSEKITRTMVFLTLISANIFLTLVNRSFYYSIITTSRYKNNLVPIIILITAVLTFLLLFINLSITSIGGIISVSKCSIKSKFPLIAYCLQAS